MEGEGLWLWRVGWSERDTGWRISVTERSGSDRTAACESDHDPFRTATVGLDMRNIDGVRIGTTAGWVLRELNVEPDN